MSVASTRHLLTEHFDSLVSEHGITVTVKPGASPRANRRDRRITIQPIRGGFSYLTALHEIAHVVGPNPSRRLDQEVAAWKWALDNSVHDPTPANYESIARCLTAYRLRAERWGGMVVPPDYDEYVESLLRR